MPLISRQPSHHAGDELDTVSLLVRRPTRGHRESLRVPTAQLNQHCSETSLRFDCGFSKDA
ncbi:hypothetical protein N7489_004606 [Penicillium chrysogenum]|jgi:hypothetical protein|uniref:uncharacterized protein n=1 Tax=Penicillium chrysogenum TaxID=5076 RepID=UPI0024DF2EA5|nr:uncharacterized protein N7489_004606 [Penicillium chrysogenum]KAJ5244510.1 hypothetical protein N7489_004606 [Penicillium chrysogenum]KAJ5852971.1 hypothetical protein N7534_005514 [Penicillium rubens]